MSRPLLITDCDEVLLHMVAHFADWLEAEHGVRFALETGGFVEAMSRIETGELLTMEEAWAYLDQFFRSEMHRQTLVAGASEALSRIAEVADIVVLTNLGDEAHGWRVEQLSGHGIDHHVICNQGGKGAPVAELIAERQPSAAVFVDDLAIHHASVAKHAPQVWRLHMIAEPRVAQAVPPADQAHARIDDWSSACDWILARFEGVQ
jgi:hypothetical protein